MTPDRTYGRIRRTRIFSASSSSKQNRRVTGLHESGMLEPAEVDAHSGYRYYTTAQVPTAQIIRRFRSFDMPEREVRAIVTTPDPTQRAGLILGHLERLERQVKEAESSISAIKRLLRPTGASVEVTRLVTDKVTIAAISGEVDSSTMLEWYSDAMAELAAVVSPVGSPGGLYDNDLFTDGRGTMTVYLPTTDAPRLGRVQPLTIGGTELATTVHHGSHDDIDVTYGALGVYVESNGLAIAGPVHEIYHVGPRDTADPSRWRTEIGWPVFGT